MIELVQGSEEWKLARCGSLGASRLADAVARTKTGYGASRANLMAELLVERLTGIPTEGFVSSAMQWGTEKEPDARAAYEFRSDVEVSQVGIVLHSTIAGTHASPDGLVGNDGLIEIKCPGTATHVETLLGDEIPGKYVTQMQWQMACTGRAWCDFVSFDPRMPESMALFIKRVQRDDVRIAELELEARKFLAELEAKVSDLRTRYERRAAA
jgi:putative phage-type endonuclease